jgi:hypothetical protein
VCIFWEFFSVFALCSACSLSAVLCCAVPVIKTIIMYVRRTHNKLYLWRRGGVNKRQTSVRVCERESMQSRMMTSSHVELLINKRGRLTMLHKVWIFLMMREALVRSLGSNYYCCYTSCKLACFKVRPRVQFRKKLASSSSSKSLL